MNENVENSARKIAVLSIIVNVATIFLAQLSIVKHMFVSPNCPDSPSLRETEVAVLEDTKCTGIFHFGVDSIDSVFVAITLFSIIPDLPANVMLIAALNSKVSWMFLPWLVVTKLKIIGCIVISCLMMHITMDVPMSHQHQYNSTTCLIYNELKAKYAFLYNLKKANAYFLQLVDLLYN